MSEVTNMISIKNLEILEKYGLDHDADVVRTPTSYVKRDDRVF